MIAQLGVTAVFALTVIACSTFSRKECLEMDWQQQGANTAMKGQRSQEGDAYFTRECKDVPVDSAAFKEGYQTALKKFCSPENMRRFSEQGGEYQDTCPSESVTSEFIMKYQTGREKFLTKKISDLKADISRLESDLSDAESTTSDLQSKVRDLESHLSSCSSR